ncbi:histidinol-phosphatase [bacterium]|nr:histidinol-phosphatase [bacterium]
MRVDYHAHTPLCHHAYGDPRDYAERAADLGLDEFGFSEHSYWMTMLGERRLAPSREEMQRYLAIMDELREDYDGKLGRPLLRVGLEADWVPKRFDEAMKFIESYPFDYVLGSVHHLLDPSAGTMVSTWGFLSQDIESVYDVYFTEVGRLARSGLCDILAHLDVIRRSGSVPKQGVLPFVDRILPDILEGDVAVEINTSGRDHRNRDFFPCRPVLELLVQAGVPITFGSDSHTPEQVGRYFDEAVEYLRSCGGTEFARFDKRQRIMTPLEDLG